MYTIYSQFNSNREWWGEIWLNDPSSNLPGHTDKVLNPTRKKGRISPLRQLTDGNTFTSPLERFFIILPFHYRIYI